jgi:hypothetical protein
VIEGLYGGWATIEEVPIADSIHGAVESAEWLIGNFSVKVHAEDRGT